MNDLISRSEAIAAVSYCGGITVREAREELMSLPAIDAVPVVHAKWVWNGFDYVGWECSHCNREINKNVETPTENYCPNCGAKMDLKE